MVASGGTSWWTDQYRTSQQDYTTSGADAVKWTRKTRNSLRLDSIRDLRISHTDGTATATIAAKPLQTPTNRDRGNTIGPLSGQGAAGNGCCPSRDRFPEV